MHSFGASDWSSKPGASACVKTGLPSSAFLLLNLSGATKLEI